MGEKGDAAVAAFLPWIFSQCDGDFHHSIFPRGEEGERTEVAEDSTLHFWQSLDGTIRNVILSKPIEPPLHAIGKRVTFIHGNRDPVTDIIRVRKSPRRLAEASSKWRAITADHRSRDRSDQARVVGREHHWKSVRDAAPPLGSILAAPKTAIGGSR